jgi:hypothetical protein
LGIRFPERARLDEHEIETSGKNAQDVAREVLMQMRAAWKL